MIEIVKKSPFSDYNFRQEGRSSFTNCDQNARQGLEQ